MNEQEYPKGAGKPESNDMVQIICHEKVARAIELQYLRVKGFYLAGPLLFSEDDLPSYTIAPNNI